MIKSFETLVEQYNAIRKYSQFRIILTTIGGSPITKGHIRLIRDCKRRVRQIKPITPTLDIKEDILWIEQEYLCVLVNSNNFLMHKHGYVFQDEQERAEIIDSIKDVDDTFIFDTNNTIEQAIRILKPHYLCKGGDRTEETMAQVEKDACLEVGCDILYGVGGSKVQSSSALLNEWRKGMDEEENFRSMLHAGI